MTTAVCLLPQCQARLKVAIFGNDPRLEDDGNIGRDATVFGARLGHHQENSFVQLLTDAGYFSIRMP